VDINKIVTIEIQNNDLIKYCLHRLKNTVSKTEIGRRKQITWFLLSMLFAKLRIKNQKTLLY